MTKRMLLTINYKNGNTIDQLVNYLHVEDNTLYFTIDRQDQQLITRQAAVPMANIISYDIEWINCDGWKYNRKDEAHE